MKVALAHDWLVRYRGGEKVLAAICEMYPQADLFTLIHAPGAVPPIVENRRIYTSFLQRVPGIELRYRSFLPLFPAAIESFRLQGYDLVISSSHCVAKGIRKPPGARHLGYVHAPMRYMWDRFDDYFGRGRASPPVRVVANAVRPWLQSWDRQSALGVDHFVANSHFIAGKIAWLYGRQASVVAPPVDLLRFASLPLEGGGRGSYFLWVGAFVPYKRLDLALEAFARLGLPLWVVGSGPGLKGIARSVPSNVRLLGQVPDDELAVLYRDARALVFTAQEDFGIAPLEAQAAGRPVIAFGAGGALETLAPETALFFSSQTADELVASVRKLEAWEKGFDPSLARANACRFSKEQFQRRLAQEVERVLAGAAT
jgi:glycosyltransferase involved in cell wall biosynthesis